MSATGRFAFHQLFIEHNAKHCGDGGCGHVALAAERFAKLAERKGTAFPENAEDFELAIGWVSAGRAGYGGLPSVNRFRRADDSYSNELE